MSRRMGIVMAAGMLLVIALLVGLGSRGVAARTYALDAPAQSTVAVLHPAARVCEGPVSADGPIASIGIWGAATGGTATLTVSVQDAANRNELARGSLAATTIAGEYQAHLTGAVAAGRPVRVCVTSEAGTFALSGSGAVHASIVMTGKPAGQEFSLVLVSDSSRSFWSWLPLAFSRASLWRPGWVGSWTFWVLAAGLLACFALGLVAIGRAAADDENEPTSAVETGAGRTPSPTDDSPQRSRAGSPAAR